MPSYEVAMGECYVHGGRFMFDPERVPVVLIDPVTNRPPDVDEHGNRRGFTSEELERTVKRPYCPECGRQLNAAARARGLPALYDETDTAR
jgi:hypothetical protein